MKSILAKLITGTLLLGGTVVAPIVPTGNGMVSWVEFSDGTQVQIPDDLYARMGREGGVAYNPTKEGATFVRAYQGSYSAQFGDEEYIEKTSSSSEPVRKTRAKNLHRPVWSDVDERVSVLSAIARPEKARAAIAFDAVAGAKDNSGLVTSITYAFTISAGSNRIAIFPISTTQTAGGGVTVTGVTYNGVAATFVDVADANGASDRVRLDLYYLIAPASGTNNVVVTISGVLTGGNKQFAVNAQSYTGADQVSQPDSSGKFSATASGAANVTVSTTVVASNTWLAGGATEDAGDIAGGSPGAGTTYRGVAQFNMYGADSNGTVSTGSQSLIWGRATNTGDLAGVIMSIKASGGAASTFNPDNFADY